MDKNRIAVEAFDQFAQAYQAKYMAQDLYQDALDLFCTHLTIRGAAILELACGPGNITSYLLSKRPDLRILATDLSPKMLALAQANNPTVECRLLDCRKTAHLPDLYDAVVCGFGLPYLSKDESIQLIADVNRRLRPAGLCYLSTMEDDYEKSEWKGPSSGGDTRVFIHFHQADYLTEALEKCGFIIVDLQRQAVSGEVGPPYDLQIIARKRAEIEI